MFSSNPPSAASAFRRCSTSCKCISTGTPDKSWIEWGSNKNCFRKFVNSFFIRYSMIKIYPKDRQAKGSFNFGKILEHKPIGFPQDGGELKPYSSLFYWAHAWSEGGGLIDQHPHKGFEIMSYVLKGEIQHYDNKLNGWKRLKAGDVQVIRAGSGI